MCHIVIKDQDLQCSQTRGITAVVAEIRVPYIPRCVGSQKSEAVCMACRRIGMMNCCYQAQLAMM